MPAMTLTIDHDELLGLTALATLDNAAGDRDTSAASAAKALMDAALASKLAREGLPWAPSAEAVRSRAAQAPAPPRVQGRRAPNPALRKESAAAAVVLVALVLLWGGYARSWTWTGFQTNGQLWDWLNLLLLPVTIAAIPLCIQYKAYIGRVRRAVYWAVIAGWTVFVIAGYLVPIGWTGFHGVTLWMWINLLVIPVALGVTMAMTSMRIRPAAALRALRPYQKGIMAALLAGWVITLIGGYALGWKWTGYTDPGNDSLWAWLSMLLAPLLLPTVLQPALLKWITGDAQARASQAPAAPAATAPAPAAG
jgi:hypothetical protein